MSASGARLSAGEARLWWGHWGLIPKLGTDVPVIMGAATERIMRAAVAMPMGQHYRSK